MYGICCFPCSIFQADHRANSHVPAVMQFIWHAVLECNQTIRIHKACTLITGEVAVLQQTACAYKEMRIKFENKINSYCWPERTCRIRQL